MKGILGLQIMKTNHQNPNAMPCNKIRYYLLSLLLFAGSIAADAQGTDLWSKGISLIPYPQKVEMNGEGFVFKKKLTIFINGNASPADKFTAEELGRRRLEQFNIVSKISTGTPGGHPAQQE